MNLAEYMMVATVIVFALAAAVALAWSVAAGQWRDRAEGARIVLDDDDVTVERAVPIVREV
jgi:cbb3-type cytochrome oxidase maturation protein